MIRRYTLKEEYVEDDMPYLHCPDCNMNFHPDIECCPVCAGELTGHCNYDWRKDEKK